MAQVVINPTVQYVGIGHAIDESLRRLRTAAVTWAQKKIPSPLQAALTALVILCSQFSPINNQASLHPGRLRNPKPEDLKAAKYLWELTEMLASGCYLQKDAQLNIIKTDPNSPISPNSCTVVWYSRPGGMTITNIKPDPNCGVYCVGLKVEEQKNPANTTSAGAQGSWVVVQAGEGLLDPTALQTALFHLSTTA